jgi:hypothetical protein
MVQLRVEYSRYRMVPFTVSVAISDGLFHSHDVMSTTPTFSFECTD